MANKVNIDTFDLKGQGSTLITPMYCNNLVMLLYVYMYL